MKSITLSRGLLAVVDDEDYARFAGCKWSASSHRRGRAYACRNVRGARVYLHRAIAGAMPGDIVDHVNGDTLDNRRQNLRCTSHAVNAQNLHCAVRGVSGHRGVFAHQRPRGYIVRVQRFGRVVYGGFHRSLAVAVAARDGLLAALEHEREIEKRLIRELRA